MKKVIRDDPRYKLEAYQFVRESLNYAQEVMELGVNEDDDDEPMERHLTGQQLCEASRRYALQEYGLMAKTVLNSWGIHNTSDLGEIVYNLIRVDLMKKSDRDQREDFNDVFDFDTGFSKSFRFSEIDDIEL